MGIEESRDPLKGTDWGTIASVAPKQSATATAVKRRPRTKIREIPECYFLPRRPWYVNLGIYGSCIAGGIGAGMLSKFGLTRKLKRMEEGEYSGSLARTRRFRYSCTLLVCFFVGTSCSCFAFVSFT